MTHRPLAVFLLVTVLALGGCGRLAAPEPAAPGSVAAQVDLRGVHLTVGSKNYSEQRLLGALYIAALRAAGATVTDRTGIGGTMLAYSALNTGQIDLYSEYTGTAWATIYRRTEIVGDPTELLTRLNNHAAPNGLSWFAMAPANSNYALVGPAELLRARDVHTLSDYAALARTDPAAARLCSSNEFATRDDGLPGIEKRYGFTLPRGQLLIQESSVSVATMTTQHQCAFASITATDPRPRRYGLQPLTDDQRFFPSYNPAIVMRTDRYREHRAAYDELLGAVNSRITQDALVGLNEKIQLENLPEARAAQEFLRAHHII